MIYNITLKPVTPFFWGIEQVSELGNKRSYYLKSANYPQQSTILGMLRYQALAQYGMLSMHNDKKEDAIKLIGANSFTYGSTNDYGAINQITPVQLQRGEKLFLMRDREFFNLTADNVYTLRKVWLELNSIKQGEFVQSVVAKNKFAQLKYRKEPINPICINESWIDKNEFRELLVEENHYPAETDFPADLLRTYNALSAVEVFQETGRVGIEKAWDSYTLNNAYYKQFFLELQEREPINNAHSPIMFKKLAVDGDWKFSFKLDWDEKKGFEFDITERFITMGGEQSVFLLSASVDEITNSLDSVDAIPALREDEVYKLLLTSDTYIGEEEMLYSLPVLVNGQTVRFRNFISKVKTTKQYFVKGDHKFGFGQSSPSYLLKRGTILYFEDASSLSSALQLIKAENSFRMIGYNHYKIETEKYHQL